MKEVLEKRYGLITAICMVVGIVIGSGIFFKAEDVLKETGGDALSGVLAWIIGGAIMVVLSATFAIMATKYEKVNGVVDYAEATCGKGYAYMVGWFISIIYFPAMTSVLAWVSARYTLVFALGVPSTSETALFSPECIAIAGFYLIAVYFINSISPRLAGKLQVSTTVAKLIPIAFIALCGTLIGLFSGNLADNFSSEHLITAESSGGGIIGAVCCTAFAYEGWIIATSINSEIKDSKRNLPLALCIGAGVIVAAYLFYYIGVIALEDTNVLMQKGTNAAFEYFGSAVSGAINFLIIFSCLGTLNGLMVGCTRGFYSLAARGEGIMPETFSQVDKKTNMPHNSASFGLLTAAIWLLYFYASQFFSWFGEYGFDSSELPIITLYPLYIPLLISFAIKEKDLHPVKRFVLPILSILGCLVMVAASIFRHGSSIFWYLIVFAVVMLWGYLLMLRRKKQNSMKNEG